jgi:DNA polymerase-1
VRIAERLGSRGLWAAAVWGRGPRAEGIVLASEEQEAPIDVPFDGSPSSEAAVAELRPWLLRPDRVFAFDDAKPALRALLPEDLDVARPVCLATLDRLLRREREEHPACTSPGDARDRAWTVRAALDERLGAVERAGLRKVARLECLVLRAFAALEHRGLHIDAVRWRALVDEAKKEAAEGREEVFRLMGDAVQRDLFGHPDLNLDADQEVKFVLERLLGRTLDDVAKGTLRALDHDVGPALLRYREAQKVVSTYGDAFLEHVGNDSRVRAQFFPLGASTGRVASREPNLQNLPSGEAFHHALCAPEGRKLVTADYGTCELRILADLSGDDAFLEAFERGEDLHSAVASRMFGVPVSKTENAELRARAKAINFGLMYGMGAAALGRQVGVDRPEAESLLQRYFESYPKVAAWLEQAVDRALAQGYAQTVLGRRLHFDEDTLSGDSARGELSRIAKNMPIQGTSADMTKLAMVRVHERLLGFDDAGLVNTIHDELVVECDANDADQVAQAVVEEMTAAHQTLLRRAPAAVDVHVGDHWAH